MNIRQISAIMLLFATAAVFYGCKNEENITTGMVETTEIDVASKIPGRIDTLYFDEGDPVKKGAVIARMESKEMDAKVEQAKGVMIAARSKMEMAEKGARPEEKEAVEKLNLQAKYQYELAQKTYDRFLKLYEDSVISRQEFDQIEFKYKAAYEQYLAADAKLRMVNKGARDEEKEAAEALFHQAENAYNEALAYQQELSVKAPVSGELYKKIADQGEVIASGYPLFSVIVPGDAYVIVQLREDRMNGIKKDDVVKGTVAALGNKKLEFKVNYISPMADFATWKPTNMKGDFDLKTFEIHLKPVKPVENLRPGMTVNINL